MLLLFVLLFLHPLHKALDTARQQNHAHDREHDRAHDTDNQIGRPSVLREIRYETGCQLVRKIHKISAAQQMQNIAPSAAGRFLFFLWRIRPFFRRRLGHAVRADCRVFILLLRHATFSHRDEFFLCLLLQFVSVFFLHHFSRLPPGFLYLTPSRRKKKGFAKRFRSKISLPEALDHFARKADV